MSDSRDKNAQGKEIYIYDTEGHYTWHSRFIEAFEKSLPNLSKLHLSKTIKWT